MMTDQTQPDLAASKKKKKNQKMSLGDFLNDGSTGGSWADQEIDLPDAPASSVLPKDAGYGRGMQSAGRSGGGSTWGNDRYGDDRSSRSSRYPPSSDMPPRRRMSPRRTSSPMREEPLKPLPDQPPYTAYVGNLPFEVNEDDIRSFFQGTQIKGIRFVMNHQTNRHKGFGYVEFEDKASLQDALRMQGQSLLGRSIRLDVADPPKSHPSEDSQWRRSDSRIAPTENSDDWRRGPRTQPQRPMRGEGDRDFRRGESDRDFRRGDGPRDFRRDGPPSGHLGDTKRHSSFSSSQDMPQQRKRLEIKPRSKPLADRSAAPVTSSKSDPFGGARPREEVLKETTGAKEESAKETSAEEATKESSEESTKEDN